jgi:protein-disulfide isomerase
VSFTYKYFPVIDQTKIGESHWAAEAAECANLQGKFWEYHDKLFSVWSGENAGTYTKPNLKKYASDLGLDTAKFNQCLDTDQTMSTVQADTGDATRLGVQGTPTFFVNGSLLKVNSLDYGEFSRTFDSLLK